MLLLLLYCRAQISGRTGRRENSCRSLMVNFTLACRSSRPDPRPDPNLKPSPDTDPLGSRCSGAALQRIYFEVCMWWRCPKQEHATERPASRPTRPTTGSFFFAWRSCIRFSHCSFRLCFQLFFFFVPVSFLFIFPFFTIFFWCAGFCIFWFFARVLIADGIALPNHLAVFDLCTILESATRSSPGHQVEANMSGDGTLTP